MHNLANYRHTQQIAIPQPPLLSDDMHRSIRRQSLNLLVFTIPMLRFLEIEIIGRLFAPDIILMGIFPFLLLSKTNRSLISMHVPRILLLLCILWFLGQFITDLVRQTPSVDSFRGWAKIILTLINFFTLYFLLYGKWQRIILYATGLAVGGILGFYLNPGIYAEGNPWKFGVGTPITWLMILIATLFSGKRQIVRVSIIGFAVLINLYMGFRSLAGICFLTMAYICFQWMWSRNKVKARNISPRSVIIVGLSGLLTAFLFILGYQFLAQKGMLGENAKQLYEWQARGDLGVLVGGRSEILVSGRAIMDSPIIGHGSWAKDYKYADLLIYLKRTLGYYPGELSELGLIPTHSHLFGAWVEAGLLGAVFWAWVLTLPVRVLAIMYKTKAFLTPLIALFAFILIWDIFFSPFGADRRFITPYFIIVMMSFLALNEKRYLRKIR